MKAQARGALPDPADLEKALRMMAKAKHPILLVGGGIHISDAHDALLRLAESQGIPVADTISGKGAIACTHPLSAGVFGCFSRIVNELIDASDCQVVVGCKLGEIATKRFALIGVDNRTLKVNTGIARSDAAVASTQWTGTTIMLVAVAAGGNVLKTLLFSLVAFG